MNCIAFDAAYSLYPQATFESRRSLCMASDVNRDAQFAKYARRGWQPTMFVSRRKKRAIRALFHPDDTRWVCDRHSWVLPLDTSDLQSRPRLSSTSEQFAWDPVVYNSWELIKYGKNMFKLKEGFPIGHTDYPAVRYEYLVDRGLFSTIHPSLKTRITFWVTRPCPDQLKTCVW